MTEEKFEIFNKEGQKIVGYKVYENTMNGQTPIILCHGFKGYMALPFISELARLLVGKGYSVFKFDFTNGIGESDGNIRNSSVTHYVNDLEKVVDYVVNLPETNKDKLTVIGTSMGGLVAVVAAAKDKRIRRLVTHSPALDWKTLFDHPDLLEKKKDKYLKFMSKSKNLVLEVDYKLYTDGVKYDAYKLLGGLKIPSLFLHSEQDEAIPVDYSKRALKVSGAHTKEMYLIPGAIHNPKDSNTIRQIAEKIDNFLSKIS